MFGPLLSKVCMRCGMRGRLFGWLPPPPPPPPTPPPPPLRPLFRLFWPGLMIPLKSRYDIIHDICDWTNAPRRQPASRAAPFSAGERYRRLRRGSHGLRLFAASTLDGNAAYSNKFFDPSLTLLAG